jgi:hypothetical protein
MNLSQVHAALRTVTLCGIAVLAGCMTVSDKQAIVQNNNVQALFAGKKIAVLPVKAQASQAPDSVAGLRNDVNKRLGSGLRTKLASAQVLDIGTVADLLNQKNSLPTFEQLLTTYENTGVIDKRHVGTLGQVLGSNYLFLSRLKAEKMDMWILGKGMGASLESMMIDTKTGEIVWGGSGEWKHAGILGFGGTPTDDAARQLVDLVLANI